MKTYKLFIIVFSFIPISVWAMEPPKENGNGKHSRNESKQEQENSGPSKKKQCQGSQDEMKEFSLFFAVDDFDYDWFTQLLSEYHYTTDVIKEIVDKLKLKQVHLTVLLNTGTMIANGFIRPTDDYTNIKNIASRDLALVEKMKRLATSYQLLGGFSFPHVYFTFPGKIGVKLIDILETLIENEQTKIQGACYLFTHPKIIEAIKRKVKQGVVIEIIIDTTQTIINKLKDLPTGMAIYRPSASIEGSIMHHKFIVFTKTVLDKNLLWRGSFNITHAANTKHYEDVTIVDNPDIIGQFQEQYNFIKSKSKRYPQLN